ncbi:ell-associated factor [Trichoderma cornu-damae]|uniref:Ell-associated factor n=1 Tax=Trichoderma cornu-damae TaxID=654480 RepID=A0A9P8QIT9_9HYPO|nr:ell-associated factor [Trichoderma cornu-damae]
MAADLIDPTAKGNYPVILGDGLLGKTSNEIFTGIRYNHKPSFPASDARLKPSIPGKTTSYDLSFSNSDGTVGFAGTRSTDDGDYVLYFDPERKAFILDKVDSTFNMNLTRVPGNSNPDELRRRFPHLESGQPQKTAAAAAAAAADKKNTANKDKAKPKPAPRADSKSITVQTKDAQKQLDKKPLDKKEKKAVEKKAVEKKSLDKKSLDKKPLDKKPLDKKPLDKKMFERNQLEKKLPRKIELALPVPEPPKPEEPKSRKKDDDEDDEDDDDGDLLIEYPGAEVPARQTHFSPSFPAPRRFDDFMDQRESEVDEDDGAMDEEDPDAEPKLPGPVKNAGQDRSGPMDVDEEEEGVGGGEEEEEGQDAGESNDAADFELDLEQELENAFEKLENSDQNNSGNGYYYGNNNANDDESEISEED